jgi:hypothetical protein
VQGKCRVRQDSIIRANSVMGKYVATRVWIAVCKFCDDQ